MVDPAPLVVLAGRVHWSGAALAFYAVAGLLWTGVANLAYSLGPFAERFVAASNVLSYRKYAHGTLVALGALSSVLWFAGAMLEAWARNS